MIVDLDLMTTTILTTVLLKNIFTTTLWITILTALLKIIFTMMALRWDDLIKLLLVKKLADHGGVQQDQTPTHEEPAPSMR
ncbi:hypothetical protein YC2023_056807 [Brassica napus]